MHKADQPKKTAAAAAIWPGKYRSLHIWHCTV